MIPMDVIDRGREVLNGLRNCQFAEEPPICLAIAWIDELIRQETDERALYEDWMDKEWQAQGAKVADIWPRGLTVGENGG
jgi:hypothetical protein